MRCDGIRSKAASAALISVALAGAVPAMIGAARVFGLQVGAKVLVWAIKPKPQPRWHD